jgi:hypothetical protein
MLGVSGFYVTASIAEAGKSGLWSEQGVAYLLAGPIAIVCAMKLHRRFRELINGK